MTSTETDHTALGSTRRDPEAGPIVQIKDLVKSYPGQGKAQGRVPAVKGVSFDIEPGEFFTMLGPSGCGKTTTLRCVAGLETPDSGEITVAGRPFFSGARKINLAASERGLGMVFQSYAIWPHMTVYQNVAFPLRILKRSVRPSKAQITEKVEQALAMVQLDHLEDRRSTNLSGGQQQRLALARALVAEPPVMLLDEPLSNLDAKLRDSMREQLKRLQRNLQLTSIYVTHDQVEALALSTRIAVMRDGEVEQIGRPREIYLEPKTRFVADFIGRTNFLTGTVLEVTPEGSYVVKTGAGELTASGVPGRVVGDEAVVAIRPEHVELVPAGAPSGQGGAGWNAVVETRQFLGEQVDHTVRLDDGTELTIRVAPHVSIPPGEGVRVVLPSEYCRVLHD